MTREKFKEELKNYLIDALGQYSNKMKNEEIRAFKFMFYGGIFPCFLPATKSNEHRLENDNCAEGWQHFDYEVPSGLASFFHDNDDTVFDRDGERYGTGYRRMASEILHDKDVVDMFEQYRLSSDFEFLIYNEYYQPDSYNFYTGSHRKSGNPNFTREAFKAQLKKYLIEELNRFTPTIRETRVCAFDISIFPWYGYIYFSFMTEENRDKEYAENWSFFNFNDYQFSSPEYMDGLSYWMQKNDFDILNTEKETEEGEAYFRICGELLHDEEVLEAFKQCRLSHDFQFLVFNQDNPTRDDSTNYYLIVKT